MKTCSVEGCDRKPVSHGLCDRHRIRTPEMRAHKIEWGRKRTAELRAMNIKCSEPGCGAGAVATMVDGKPTRCRAHCKHTKEEARVYQKVWEKRRMAELIAMNAPCSVPGCRYPALCLIVDGEPTLCRIHYQYTTPKNKSANTPLRQRLGAKCAICGYDRLTPHAHRIVAGGPYTFENCIPLCANHHNEVHRGLISTDELLKYKSPG